MATLSFLGDVFLSGAMRYNVALPGDYVFNLEGPITETTNSAVGKICLKMTPGCIQSTFSRLPAAVCIGNNHIMDYGEIGLEETISELDSLGIRYFGAGTLSQNCNNPLLIDVDGMKIALAAYVCPSTHAQFACGHRPGVAPIDIEIVSKDVIRARNNGAERLIVNLHWGVEEVGYMRPRDFDLAGRILDLGVDLIVGHHAHCIQPIWHRDGQYAFFGLGNAVFPDIDEIVGGHSAWTKFRSWNNTSLICHYNLDAASVGWGLQALRGNQVVPVRRSFWAPKFVSDSSRTALEKRFARHLIFSRWRYAASRFSARPNLTKLTRLTTFKSLFASRDGSVDG
jgi:hypothetical protein